MRIYKIIAIINIVLISISLFTGLLIGKNREWYNGKMGLFNGFVNLLLFITVPTDIILFLLGI